MTKLKILFVNRMAGLVRGGGETFDLEISRALEALGCEVTYLTGAPMFGHPPLPINHPRVHCLHTPYLPWFPWDKMRSGWRVKVFEFQWFERRAASWIRKHAGNFDVIQVCELPYLVSLLKKGCRVSGVGCRVEDEEQRSVFGVRAVGEGDKAQRSKSTTLRPSVRVKGGSDREISRNLKPEHRTHFHKSKIVLRLTAPNAYDPWDGISLADAVIASGTSIEKIRKTIRPDVVDVPNGVDLGKFRSQKSEVRSQNDDGGGKTKRAEPRHPDPVLLYVARFQAFKNHDLLIRSFKKVVESYPQAVLQLAGSGPLREKIEKQVGDAGLGGNVSFLGEVPHANLPAVYRAADLAVISSEYESFCFAAIEAMASGLPIVTTDCGWVPGLIGDNLPPVQYQWTDEREDPARFAGMPEGGRMRLVPGGIVVMRGDADSLAGAMVKMIRDSGLSAGGGSAYGGRDTCGAWNRAKAEREHGWESSARTLLGVYEGMVGSER